VLTAVIFAVAFLAPVFVVLGLVLWRRYIAHDAAAGAMMTAVALGLLAGILMGGTVAGLLVGAALLLARARR
jgi:hypothetical protein